MTNKCKYDDAVPFITEKANLIKASKGRCIIAIDGRSASGKTTLAAALSSVFNADVVHMDDFFLPIPLRTPGRLSEPGGNVHYERFAKEVLPNLDSCQSFSYGIFDCGIMEINNKQTIGASPFRLIEGAYSLRPAFGAYADLSVFCDIDPKTQMDRIIKRNGPEKADVFKTRWIPLEERYFSAFPILESADLVISAP